MSKELETILGTILLIIAIGVYFFKDNIVGFFSYLKWKRDIKGKHDYDAFILDSMLKKIAKKSFKLKGKDVPYGRTNWFIDSNEKFIKQKNGDDINVYGYAPVRSKQELEFKEYGLLLTSEGIFYSYQKNEKDEDGNSKVVSKKLSFKGLWKIKYNKKSKTLMFYYPYGIIRVVQLEKESEVCSSLENSIDLLIKTGYTRDLLNKKLLKVSKRQIKEYSKSFELTGEEILMGALGNVCVSIGPHLHEETINGIVQSPMGHGFAAEYANNLTDKVSHPLKEVKRVGQDNARNGADRIVGNIKIQTKYCSSARNSVNAAFDPKDKGGMYRYKGMQLEVPKEQYNEAVEIMKKKIADGKVEGHSNPNDAYKIVRKGHVTWVEAHNIARGGNITSLKYDTLDGVIQTLPMAGISFIIVFAQAKWSGKNTKDAALIATKRGLVTLAVGTVTFAGSQQIAKIITNKIVEESGKKIMAETVAKRASYVISFGIVVAPSIFDNLSGRISSEQLLKNAVVAGGGLLASAGAAAGAGAVLGSVVPGAGNVVGAVVGTVAGVAGGIIGANVTKSIMDNFIEDDRVEMFAQLKEEFIDVVMSISLDEDEFEQVQLLVFDKSLEDKLKDMYQHTDEEGSREYAREEIVEASLLKVIKKRQTITEQDILDGIEMIKGN